MNLFGFRRPALTAVKAWCSPFGADGLPGELLALVDRLLALLPEAPLEGSLNDSEPQSLSTLRRALARLAPAELESLRLLDAGGELALLVGRDTASTPAAAGAPVLLFVVMLPPAGAASSDRVLALLAGENLHHGYIRSLGARLDPVTEARPRPGAAPEAAAADRAGWLVPEADVRAGAVRGLYPANLLSGVALARLAGSGLKLPASIPAGGGVPWKPSPAEQKELVRRNPDFRAFLHFGAD